MNPQKVKEKLRHLVTKELELKQLSQTDFASLTGVAQGTIGNITRGTSIDVPNHSTLHALSRYFGYSEYWEFIKFLTQDNEPLKVRPQKELMQNILGDIYNIKKNSDLDKILMTLADIKRYRANSSN